MIFLIQQKVASEKIDYSFLYLLTNLPIIHPIIEPKIIAGIIYTANIIRKLAQKGIYSAVLNVAEST